MEVVGCSGAKHISRKISEKMNANYSELELKKFPDGEINIRFKKDLKNKNVLLIQSFYENINEKIVEILFAYYSAKDLGAKKIKLLALYFPYFRQDKRFIKGQGISIKSMSKIFCVFDKIFVVEPHLHRIKKIKQILPHGKRISVIPLIANYFKNLKINDFIFVGPDSESSQWTKNVAKILKKEYFILRKKRYGSRNVKIKLNKKIDIENKNIVIIDDIISTGGTMLKTIKELKKLKPKQIYCVGIHGVFADKKILEELEKEAKIISTNTILSKLSKIDISDIAGELK